MRYLLLTLIALFIATPALAESGYCRMDGPRNCYEQDEDQLVNLTKGTINQMQLTHPGHAFRTQNDVVLEKAARAHASLPRTTLFSASGVATLER